MSCSEATAPINIVYNLAGDCQLKCDYVPRYTTTSVSAQHKGDYILYTFDITDTSTTFNTELYNATEMRLYQPSLHQYAGNRSGAELLISHTNVSKNKTLLVCIPVDIGESSEDGVVESLIGQVAARANTEGGSTTINLPGFKISSLIPVKPFYSYTGTTPFNPCNETAHYVVFNMTDAIKIRSPSLKDLQSIITPNNYDVKTNPDGYFYNKNGPSNYDLPDDKLYIDCIPTGSEGKIMVDEDVETIKDNNNPVVKKYLKYMFKNVNQQWVINLIISIVAVFFLVKGWGYLVEKIIPKPTETLAGE